MIKRILISTALLVVTGQWVSAQSIGDKIEPEFSVTEVPEKWKDESAVIIGMKEEYLFTRKLDKYGRITADVLVKEYVHKRIRLLDKNAVEKFSTFYYVTMGADGSATYQVIKPDGKVVDIDMKNAIEEEQDVPEIYKPIFFKLKVRSMKIAIPDLAAGDIIDYTIRSTLPWNMKESGINFTPFIFSLANSYPTMYQQYRFTMANGMKVQYRGFNNAPNIKFDPKATVYGEKESYVSYYFMDKDRDKTMDERWSYELRNTPSVKFRVVFFDYDPDEKTLGEATVDRAGIDVEKMYKYYVGAAMYNTTTTNSMAAYVAQYLITKKASGEIKNDQQVIREAYYCLRKVFLEMYYKGPVHSELEKYITGKKLYKKMLANEKKEQQKEEKEDEVRMQSITFATAYRTILAGMGIQAELFVYLPRSLGTWRDAIFMEELDFVIKVKSKDKTYFLESMNNFESFGTPYAYLQQAEGYSIRYDEPDSYYKTSVPAYPAQTNTALQEYHVSFNDAFDLVNVERTSSYTGTEKKEYIGMANLDRSYLNEDFEKYYLESLKTDKKKDPAVPASSKTYDYPEKDEQIAERKKLFEKDLAKELTVDQYNQFELLQSGRYGDTAVLSFKENFTLSKLLNKAGRNYIFEVGKLIGSQIKLSEKELKERRTDIWVPVARILDNKINIRIPAGYTIEGLEELNKSVDNASGSFISTAKVNGDTVEISTRKVYKNIFDKKEAWPNYVAFLEAGYQFSQAKIVLKKK